MWLRFLGEALEIIASLHPIVVATKPHASFRNGLQEFVGWRFGLNQTSNAEFFTTIAKRLVDWTGEQDREGKEDAARFADQVLEVISFVQEQQVEVAF